MQAHWTCRTFHPGLIIAVLLPFVPVALAAVPLRTILETVTKLLL